MHQIEVFINEKGKKFYNYCLKLTSDPDKAEDLYQDVWAKVLSHSQPKEESAFEPWLYKICTNLYIDHYRRFALTKKLLFLTKDEEKEDPILRVPDPAPSVEEHLIHEQEKSLLKAQIEGLQDKYKIPLILYYYNEYSYKVIGEILGLKEGTVKSRIFTGKEKLRERMVAHERRTIRKTPDRNPV